MYFDLSITLLSVGIALLFSVSSVFCSWIIWTDTPVSSLSCLTCFLVFTVILVLYSTLCSSISLALAGQGDPDVKLKIICLCEYACFEVVSKNVQQCGQQPLLHFPFWKYFCMLSLTLILLIYLWGKCLLFLFYCPFFPLFLRGALSSDRYLEAYPSVTLYLWGEWGQDRNIVSVNLSQ